MRSLFHKLRIFFGNPISLVVFRNPETGSLYLSKKTNENAPPKHLNRNS